MGGFGYPNPLSAGPGSATAPAVYNPSAATSGIYFNSTATRTTVAGVAAHEFGAAVHDILSDSGELRMGTAQDARLRRHAAGEFFIHGSAGPGLGLNIPNVYTDASNYEVAYMRWSSNVIFLGGGKQGSGTNRAVRLTTDYGTNYWNMAAGVPDITPTADNTQAIGSASLRLTNLHARTVTGGSSSAAFFTAFVTGSALPATSGVFRLSNNEALSSRDQGNSANIELIKLDTSNRVVINSAAGGGVMVGGTATSIVGFFGTTPTGVQTGNAANLTNNLTAGGSDGVFATWTDLTTYANDAATIRNTVYQIARALKMAHDGMRAYGLLT